MTASARAFAIDVGVTWRRLPMPPAFLAHRFDVDALATAAVTYVAVDARGIILWFNEAWETFARDNRGVEILSRFGPGSSYLAAIPRALRDGYEAAFGECLRTGKVFEQDYECSSPELFRMFHLRVLPIGHEGLLLEHSMRVERAHDRVTAELQESRYRSDLGIVVQCSNCRRVRQAGSTIWDWIPEWTRSPPDRTSHGLCTACAGFYW